jgi:hypothetical protein
LVGKVVEEIMDVPHFNRVGTYISVFNIQTHTTGIGSRLLLVATPQTETVVQFEITSYYNIKIKFVYSIF